ncbi:MAG: ABC transporter ATP-binding protein [Candidatus Bathyarchaeia archaeon]
MKEATEVIQIRDLYLNFYTYEGVVKALDGVSLNVKKGEILGIVGETGCGKSVTSLSILKIVTPPGKIEGGRIEFNIKGKTYNILELNEQTMTRVRGRYISMVFQEPRAALNPVYTVGDQIGEVFYIHRKEEIIKAVIEQLKKEIETTKGFKRRRLNIYLSLYERMLKNPRSLTIRLVSKVPILRRFRNLMNKEIRKRTVELLEVLRVPDPERVVDMYPHELSGGMAQRCVIAMALVANPLLLIADEPTTNLDVTVQAQILVLIKELQKKLGSTILYITHDLGVVAELCDRVAVMYAGNVVEIADVMTLFKKPLHPYTQGLLESIPRPGRPFTSIPGVVPSLINPPPGCRFNERCKYAMDICWKKKPELIDAGKDHYVACHLYSSGGK